LELVDFLYEPIVSSLGVGSTNVPRVHLPCLVNQMELLGHDFFLFTQTPIPTGSICYTGARTAITA